MNTLKLIWLTFLQLVRPAGSLPQTIAPAADQGRRQAVLNKSEAERLDRICHPEKYQADDHQNPALLKLWPRVLLSNRFAMVYSILRFSRAGV